MIISLMPGADPEAVRRALTALGLWAIRFEGRCGGPCFVIERHSADVDPASVLAIEGVAEVSAPTSAHPLLDSRPAVVRVGDLEMGPGCAPVLMAGPCSVESEQQIDRIAARVASAGARVLRGGAFKPRSSPYAFRGVGGSALAWLRAAADRHGLLVVTEALGEETAELVAEHADLIQIGSRNMHNYSLLERVSGFGRPVLLKRGMAATIDEWLLSAEYCLLRGAPGVVFCERGVRGFDPSTRNLLDLGAVALLSAVHQVPVIVDPSHSLGRRDLVLPLSGAALAAGACGLLVEVHDDPAAALSDGPQALSLEAVEELARLVETHDKDRAPVAGGKDPASAVARGKQR